MIQSLNFSGSKSAQISIVNWSFPVRLTQDLYNNQKCDIALCCDSYIVQNKVSDSKHPPGVNELTQGVNGQ